jgi:hypothetical protein
MVIQKAVFKMKIASQWMLFIFHWFHFQWFHFWLSSGSIYQSRMVIQKAEDEGFVFMDVQFHVFSVFTQSIAKGCSSRSIKAGMVIQKAVLR